MVTQDRLLLFRFLVFVDSRLVFQEFLGFCVELYLVSSKVTRQVLSLTTNLKLEVPGKLASLQ
jgi:hypothetical protein